MKNSKKIMIINTGGTISSVDTPNGLAPAEGYLEQVFSTVSALRHPLLPSYLIQECAPLIDSANMSIEKWNQIATSIATHYDSVDGFIIFHGTDTMAYTASALSFMLKNLAKPIILTGSQLPLSNVRSDGIGNTITSLILSAQPDLFEVCVYFNRRLLRGNRTRKLYSHNFDAFDSPNYPPLAMINMDVQLNYPYLLSRPEAPLQVQHLSSHPIVTFRLFPGFCLNTLRALLALPIRVLVLETYGAGNAPNDLEAFLTMLHSAIQRGILVVNSTQCVTGRVEMSQYATGAALEKIGSISAADMTPEALYSKLIFACSCTEDVQMLKKIMQTNECGEMRC